MAERRDRAAPERRRRDAGETRAAILDAARVLFGEKGYDAASTRDIATRAGVNVALISRYFGSKEALFAEAVPRTLSIGPYIDGDMAGFGARMARLMVSKQRSEGYYPMIALLRSASSADAIPSLQDAYRRQILEPLAARLSGAGARERAGLIAAQLAGFDVIANVLGLRLGSGKTMRGLERRLAKSLQAMVDP